MVRSQGPWVCKGPRRYGRRLLGARGTGAKRLAEMGCELGAGRLVRENITANRSGALKEREKEKRR